MADMKIGFYGHAQQYHNLKEEIDRAIRHPAPKNFGAVQINDPPVVPEQSHDQVGEGGHVGHVEEPSEIRRDILVVHI